MTSNFLVNWGSNAFLRKHNLNMMSSAVVSGTTTNFQYDALAYTKLNNLDIEEMLRAHHPRERQKNLNLLPFKLPEFIYGNKEQLKCQLFI